MSTTPPPSFPPSGRPSGTPWFEDPLEVDRHLDGEGSDVERAERTADVAVRPDVEARLGRRSAFLEALRSARWAPGGSSEADLRALDLRVRAALESPTEGVPASSRSRWRTALVGVAAALAGVGAWFLAGNRREAEALNPVALAAEVLNWKPLAFGTCAQGGPSDVHGFALVRDGEMQVSGCAQESQPSGASVARLYRPEELPVLGYVAVPAPGETAVHEIGLTEVESGRVLVFDVLDHGRRVYLAVSAASLKPKKAEDGERWTCAACHGPDRQAQKNPHRIVLRRAP